MKKYLPNNAEMRTAVFTAIATSILLLIGCAILQNCLSGMRGGYDMGNMRNMKMSNMHKMPNGEMMMDMEVEKMDEMDMSMAEMSEMLEGKTGAELEKAFIVGMIPHHQGAVDMAKVLLKDKKTSAEMKKFAEQIISAQEGEIEMMNDWLMKN